MTDATKPAGDPIGWLCRTKQQVIDAEKAFPGEPHDYLWKYTHGTKDMERFAAFPDLDVMPLYASPSPVSGMAAALADRERAIAEAVAGERASHERALSAALSDAQMVNDMFGTVVENTVSLLEHLTRKGLSSTNYALCDRVLVQAKEAIRARGGAKG